jgi:hypothetical protein
LGLFVFVYGLGRRYIANARFIDLHSAATDKVNPLSPSYASQRIKLSDIADPLENKIGGKTFDRCDIYGPAVVTISGLTAFLHCTLINTDHVLLRDDASIHNVILLDGTTFNRCRIIGLTFLIPPAAAHIIQPGVNWITPPPNVAAQLPEPAPQPNIAGPNPLQG